MYSHNSYAVISKSETPILNWPSGVLGLLPVGCFTTGNNASREWKQNLNTAEWQRYMTITSAIGQDAVKYYIN